MKNAFTHFVFNKRPPQKMAQTLFISFMVFFLALSNNAFSATATASKNSSTAKNVLDGNINTRWSGNGIGTTLKVDLGSTRTLTAVKLAFYKGNQRTAKFDLQVSTNNNNWSTVRTNAVSSGKTLYNQTFSFSQKSARYVRFVNKGNSQNNWGSLTKFSTTSTSSTPTSPPTSGNCNKPSDVLDLKNWKITVPYTSGTSNTDGSTKKAGEVKQPSLDSYERSPIFTNSGCNYVQFRAHAGGATTNGSGYPRSELREMKNNGKDLASWSSTSGTHTFEVDLRVSKLPSKKPHLVVAQIHGGGDDIITFRVEGKKMVMEIDGKDGPTLDSNFSLNKRAKLKWVVSGGKTKSYYNGKLVHTLTQKYSGAYFKTGAYTQSACGGSKKVSGESCSAYGETEIFNVKFSHK